MAWAVTLIQISKGDFYAQPSKISQNFNVMESKNMLKCFNYDYSKAFFFKSVLKMCVSPSFAQKWGNTATFVLKKLKSVNDLTYRND